MLSTLEDPARRKALILAFSPLWKGVNGSDDGRGSYPRWIGTAAPKQQTRGSDAHIATAEWQPPGNTLDLLNLGD